MKAARPRPRRVLNSAPQRLYRWQKEALTPVAAARGAALDPAAAAGLRQRRATGRRPAPEVNVLKKAAAGCLLWAPALAATGSRGRYRFIAAPRSPYPVRLPCQAAAVPASACYAWQRTQTQASSEPSPAWKEAGGQVFGRRKRRAGAGSPGAEK